MNPAFRAEGPSIARLEEIAWLAYTEGRKAPVTQKAGPGYADPDYDLSSDWVATKQRIDAPQARWSDPAGASRVLLVCGSARNDGACPGEMSKSFRLTQLAREIIAQADIDADVLDVSLITSDYGRNIHPCKGCASTAMPLCHWPCSCHPNHALNQTNDWMAEIYERWTAAHAVIIVTPVYWYQSPSPLKLMIDRLVCADGGNADPTSTSGKKAGRAKEIEMAGWSYPQHLAGRAYGLVVHGDVAGVEDARRSLSDWLDSSTRAPRHAWTATSAISNPMPPATTRWTGISRCGKKRATWRARWSRQWSNCVRGAYRRCSQACGDRGRSSRPRPDGAPGTDVARHAREIAEHRASGAGGARKFEFLYVRQRTDGAIFA